MGGFFWFILFCLILIFVFKRILIYFINLIFAHKLNLEVRLGQVSLLPPSIQDCHFLLHSFTIHVDKVRLTSSLVNADVKRLMALVIEDVRITKDFYGHQGTSRKTRSSNGNSKILEKLIKPLTTFVQFMCISVTNVTIVAQLENNLLIHSTINNVTLDGSILPRVQIAVCASVDACSTRLLQTVITERSHNSDVQESPVKTWQPCLAELAIGIQTEIHINAKDPAIEKLSVSLNSPLISVNDRLFTVLKQMKSTGDEVIPNELEGQVPISWTNLVPRKCDLTVTGTELKLVKDGQSAFVNTFLNSLLFSSETCNEEAAHDGGCRIKAKLLVQSLHSETQLGRWLSLTEGEGIVRMNDEFVDATVNINRLSVLYTHTELSSWLHLLPQSKRRKKSSHELLQKQTVPLKLNLQAWDLSVVAVFPESLPLRSGMTHFTIEILKEPSTSTTAEFQAETLWCCLGHRTPSDPGQKKVHFWNSPLYIGLIIGKMEREFQESSLKTQILLDVIRFEWSPNLINTLMAINSGLSKFREQINADSEEKSESRSLSRHYFSVTAAGANIFLLMKKDAALVMRIDSIAADKQPDKMAFSAEGVKGLFILPGAPFSCAKSADIKKGNVDLKRVQVVLRANSEKPRNVELENLDIHWDTRFHMAILQVLEEFKAFWNHFKSDGQAKSSSASNSRASHWTIQLKHQSSICAALSPRHSIELKANEPVKAFVCGSHFELSVPRCALLFDGHSILETEGLVWTLADEGDEQIIQERSTFEYLSSTNRCALVNVAQLRLCFPYRYAFAEACQQELVNVFKWLKLLHKKRISAPMGPGVPCEERLYRDLHISVARFSLQLCDDPFEVKLRDNYELREDEYHESVKRKRMLDTKIEELRKTHPLLTQGKIDELYANLACKNAEIYVQRAQRMYETRPMRTALFRWEMELVDIIALADPCFYGYDNIVRNIQEMDPESPWPDEGISFTTLWCRHVRATCRQWRFLLRDFPQPLLHIQELLLFGRLAGAEQQSLWRAKRTCIIPVAQPWSDVQIERGMSALKFYYDFSCDAESWRLAYGPCWEPVIAQCNLAWDFVSPPSKDPSPPLPIWDKLRLILHGRLTMSTQQMTLLLHTSLDPYSTTEEMEVTWTDLAMDWTNANFIFKGDFHVYVRTASKYDDCRLLYIPKLKLTARLSWLCLADPNDHHSVSPCAPDRVPEYSINQEHDSYRAFRSQNLSVALSMETKPGTSGTVEVQALLYGSTLRWFENLKFILSGVSRPTRRGKLFQSVKPRKIQLSRHYKSIRLALSFHRFHICYWMSVSMQRGFELNCGRLTLSSEHSLRLVPFDDGLKHRPKADWSILFLNCELQDAEIWLQSALGPDSGDSSELNVSLRQPVEKFYFLSVQRVSYGREAALTPPFGSQGSNVPTHRLVVQDLRGAWTKSNRLVVFALYDSWIKAQLLKRNLSSEVMKLLRFPESSASPIKPRNPTRPATAPSETNLTAPASSKPSVSTTPIADSMLQQLLADVHHQNVVFSEDLSSGSTTNHPSGVSADQEGHLNWLIELVDSQVLLKGCETKGYIIISAAQAKILQKLHPPVWRDRSLVSKTSWICSLDGMQYFATISAGEQDAMDEKILWLSTDHIGSRESHPVVSIPDMVGSGQSVGGVISETVGGCASSVQLQRIVSRCKCELVFVSYGNNTLDLEHDLEHGLMDLPLPPSDDVMDLWAQREEPVDSFTLTHHDLNICTNSPQYEMLLDVINNLLLYVEPHRKEASERLQRLRFQLQLSSTQDQRRPVQQLQNQLRTLISQLRRLEKDAFLLQRALAEDPSNATFLAEFDALERKENDYKEKLNAANEELAMMVSCLKEAQLSAHQRLQAARQGNHVTTLRRSEINFKHAQWRLTEVDGQLGIADVVLSNFLYKKSSRSDDSCEHSLEIGYVSVTNLLPNQVYKQVIVPTEMNRNMPVDRQVAVRMFSRDKAPVGGICIKEIFEINVVPFTFAMTYQFFKTMMRFCFPEKDPETLEDGDQDAGSSASLTRKGAKHFAPSSKSKNRSSKESSFYVPIEDKDDVEKMKERAEKNKLFIYIKIPEVPVKVSYKGGREKNIEDVHEFSLVVPTLEYHNVTWTWLDLFLAMKNDSKRVLLSQAIKQKLQIRPRTATEEGGTPQEEDKARLLLGGLSMPGDARSSKRSFFKTSK